MNNKFWTALNILKSDVECTCYGTINTEEDFNKIKWKTGVDENGITIDTLTNPHPEITWDKVKAEMDKIQAEYNSLTYARARELAYPITKEFIEAYTEKEIGGDSTKWDAYIVKYNKVRNDNPKP
tara:strand:- start:31 stop:405 length:375 start_codon:yes stop_codon:yes gene_type:complete